MACAHAVAASPTGAMAGASQLIGKSHGPWLSRRAADDCHEAPPVEDNQKKRELMGTSYDFSCSKIFNRTSHGAAGH